MHKDPGPTECPFESLETVMACHPMDWGGYKRDAWIWGIVLGWDSEDEGEDPMSELAKKFHWNDEAVARLRRLHECFQDAKKAYQSAGEPDA